jgi:hypothetical protein
VSDLILHQSVVRGVVIIPQEPQVLGHPRVPLLALPPILTNLAVFDQHLQDAGVFAVRAIQPQVRLCKVLAVRGKLGADRNDVAAIPLPAQELGEGFLSSEAQKPDIISYLSSATIASLFGGEQRK